MTEPKKPPKQTKVKVKVIDLSWSTETDPKKAAELIRKALEDAFPPDRDDPGS